MPKDKHITVRVNGELLKELSKDLGVDESKTIRACMNCTKNVIHGFFGGEITHIFKRKKTNEEIELYEKNL